MAGFLDQRAAGVALIAHDQRVALLANDAACAVEPEERDAIVLCVNLGVVTVRHHVGAGRRRETSRLTGRRELAHEERPLVGLVHEPEQRETELLDALVVLGREQLADAGLGRSPAAPCSGR